MIRREGIFLGILLRERSVSRSYVDCQVLGGRGGKLNLSTFLKDYFCSQKWKFSDVSRGDQALRQPCKYRNLAILYQAKKPQKFTISIVFT